jgi:aryl-alcohol dehydrogenase-like predicted oxidoreductase
MLSVVQHLRQQGLPAAQAIAQAQASMLVVGRESRTVMLKAMELFQGSCEAAALDAVGCASDKDRFYADLYLGLWAEAQGNETAARRAISAANESAYCRAPPKGEYMHHVARIHLIRRGWEPSRIHPSLDTRRPLEIKADCNTSAPPLPPNAYTLLNNGSRICRVISGLWQLSGAHGFRPELAASLADMRALINAGFNTFDLADIYGPSEDFVGALLAQSAATPPLDAQFHTKYVPRCGPMPMEVVLAGLDKSRHRMRQSVLDLVAFHWWDYEDKRYLNLLRNAQVLAQTNPPVLKAVALTNMDTQRLVEIVEEGRVVVTSNQVSFSLIDTRPLDGGMARYAESKGIKLLVYGSLLGGLLSEKWLGRAAPRTNAELDTASLRKYFNFVQQWGSWTLFQELLTTLKALADKYYVSIANVAMRWVLQQEAVGAVIVGMRLGHSAQAHIQENIKTFSFELTPEDMVLIARVQSRGRKLLNSLGDCGDEYR